MTAETWPPPASEDTVWTWKTVGLRRDDQERVRVRRVVLWGSDVWWSDESQGVWCPCHWQFQSVEVLGTRGNGHSGVSPFAGKSSGQFVPVTDEDEPSRPVGLGGF